MTVAARDAILACTSCRGGADVTQACAGCGHALCPACWGTPWAALACERCRGQARWRHPAGRHLRVVR